MTIWKYQKIIFKTFLRSTLFLFRPLFPKYQHFLALKAYISEMRAEIETVEVAWALLFDFALISMSFKFLFFPIWTFRFWPLPQKLHIGESSYVTLLVCDDQVKFKAHKLNLKIFSPPGLWKHFKWKKNSSQLCIKNFSFESRMDKRLSEKWGRLTNQRNWKCTWTRWSIR